MIQPNPHRSGLVLSLGVALAVAITAIVFIATQAPRKLTKQRILSDQISALLPTGSYDSDPAEQAVTLNQPASSNVTINRVYPYKTADLSLGAVIQATTTQGYSGEIELLIAVEYDGTVHGVAVVAHTETPGLGDKIEQGRSDWLQQFTNLSSSSLPPAAWAVKKDGGEFDHITGATVTPRAVVNAVSDTIHWYSRNRDSLQ